MTVAELIAALRKLPKGALVVMAKDEEGNGFSPFAGAVSGVYDAESTWSGDFFHQRIIGDEDYFQPTPEAVPAICLWPLN